MNKLVLGLAALATISLSSCSSDDDAAVVIETNNVTAPDTYMFERNGNTTVSFSGQTTRILMPDEIVSGL